MKRRVKDFARFGGVPEFPDPLHVAQVNLPDWEKFEDVFRDIFTRQYYANHGPLVQELDQRFADFVGAKHAVCVTNGTVALMLLAKALDLSGEVIVPAFTFPATVQALQWAGLTPVLCDVDPDAHMLTPETIAPCITPQTSGILGVHLWGRSCNPEHLQAFAAERGLVLFFDACHATGCSHNHRRIGTFGSGEAFSFHATKIVNGGEGGCITTNDDTLADHLRTMRSFHSTEKAVHVPFRMNGKMSEAQAGLALLSLDQFPDNVLANRYRYKDYLQGLESVSGLRLIEMETDGDTNNFQYVVLEVDNEKTALPRDLLLKLLESENVYCRRHFYPGLHRVFPQLISSGGDQNYEVTEALAGGLLQLPNSQSMTSDHVERVCELIRDMCESADMIREKLNGIV